MSIVLAQNVILSDGDGLTLDHPIVGWDNIVTIDNLVADTEVAEYPATNLANPATHLSWHADDTSVQYLTVTTGSADDFDFIGIAGHNFSSEGIAVSIDGDDGGGYDELVAPVIPANDGPLLFRFTAAPFVALRVKLATGDAAPQASVLYAGKLLVLPRKLYQGFTPPSYGRTGREVNAFSEAGDYLGSIITQRHVESKIPLSLLDPTYYREQIDPFIAARVPFFIGWRPQSYPNEVGYMTLTNWPQPVPQSPHSRLALELAMRGIV